MENAKTVAERIEQGEGGEVINLDKREKEIYIAHNSFGRRIIYFSDGHLRELFDPDSDTLAGALVELRDWLDWTLRTGEVWIANCSPQNQLSDLRRVTMEDPASLVATESVAREYYS
jgi:hypothetical protein